MNQSDCVIALKANYRLDKHLYDLTIDMLSEVPVDDFKGLLGLIINSKKFDYLSKLEEAIGITKNEMVKLSNQERNVLYKYIDQYNEYIWDYFTSILEMFQINNVILESERSNKILNGKVMEKEINNIMESKCVQVINIIGKKEICRLIKNNNTYILKKEIERVILELNQEKRQIKLGFSKNIKRISNV